MKSMIDLARDRADALARIRARFPNLDEGALSVLGADPGRLEAHLAATHNLTATEAHEELADFLYVETLSRELGGD
ncbi:MAG: hypothetical protein KDK02_10820 [Rhodobacteraceae bacterium]|nr:hypothetical protein [Paracoccaceae bacterium]